MTSHEEAANEFLAVMGMDDASVQLTDTLVQLFNNEDQEAVKRASRRWTREHLYPACRAAAVSRYVEDFSEADLRALTAFYSSPLGRRVVEKLPAAMAYGMEYGARAAQALLPELRRLIAYETRTTGQT